MKPNEVWLNTRVIKFWLPAPRGEFNVVYLILNLCSYVYQIFTGLDRRSFIKGPLARCKWQLYGRNHDGFDHIVHDVNVIIKNVL